jgi:hypothetical protein
MRFLAHLALVAVQPAATALVIAGIALVVAGRWMMDGKRRP